MDLTDYDQRYALVNELHARPSPRITAPCTAVFLAFKEPRDAASRDRGRDRAHLADLTRRHGAAAPAADVSHYAATLGRHELHWEQHTEFVTYSAFAPGVSERPFDPALAAIFPQDWQATAPGKRACAAIVHVDLLPDDPAQILPKLGCWFAQDGLTVFWVLDESAAIAADFRIDPNGWMRFAVFVRPGTGPGRTGRIVQRLLELETYRMMSMLGLERARHLGASLNRIEPRLSRIMAQLGDDATSTEASLHELLDVSAQLETEATQHAFRFGATKAYEAIVMDRIAALREARFLGRLTLTEFMARRYLPAMRTARSTEVRLDQLLTRAARAAELLRTRVDVQRSAQNQAVLASMDRRADLQLRLQHTVEGLSVVAISYYAVGLAGYALAPLAKLAHMDKAWLTAALVPLVVGTVWLAMRRIKARLHEPH
ncbi:MAG: DUF3422 domain-containing protein [Paracoccus sp. (in: a-proteobacteria)]|uniref:DUF3422 family protein n=1 Tax=Paracoccus sp. TaxID=267 RepID=UPI0026DFD215|nr:DUF3422 domain-containing protein [Paracoccus sp. (in: a-proteobacteria)]MDO5621391.1 DUF3422 domain-containing protein [Paracoccus sp. (in: a-proteobacteria)]